MRSFGTPALTFAITLLPAPAALADKTPLSPADLQAKSRLIVVGKVESDRTEEKDHEDGSRTVNVVLTVLVESAAKGDAKVGQPIEVQCWRVVKAPRDAVLWDTGNSFIPAPGARARFYLEKKVGDVWLAQWPSGIEPLEGAAQLNLPQAQVNQAPATGTPNQAAAQDRTVSWPYVVGAGILAVVILILIMIATVRHGPTEPAPGPPDAAS